MIASALSVIMTPQTTFAYKCTGSPDDYYTRDLGTFEGFDAKAKITPGQRDAANSSFKWDESLGKCTVTVPDLDNARESSKADGSFAGCNGNETRVSTLNRCAPLVTYSTNDKPVHDNGKPIDKSSMACGEDDAYDEESFSCVETGTCKATGSCDYHKVGLDEDNTVDAQGNCVKKGGDWVASGNGGTCKNTDASCKAQNKILSNGTCVSDPTAACKAQYPSTTTPANPFAADKNKAAREACIAGATNGNCEAQTDPVLKKACEDGAAAKNAVYSAKGDAGTCGDAKTNLVTCDGAGGIQALGGVLKIILFILTILIGIVATGGIVYGAILYASAQDNAGQVSQAKTIIRDVAIGLLLYGFMMAIINWLVPGGVIS